jgi:hypothetical protein
MKRIYIAIVFVLIAGTLAGIEAGYIGAKVDAYISNIEITDKYMRKDDFENAINACNALEASWDENAENIDLLLIHDYVDNIGIGISKMRAYAENGSPDMYFAESTSVKKQLTSIKESELPLFENIL